MQNYLCKNLKYLRKSKKLSQQELSQLIGIKRSTYAHWEKAGISFKNQIVYSNAISRELGYSINHLIKIDLQQNNAPEPHANKTEEILNDLVTLEEKIKEIKGKILNM